MEDQRQPGGSGCIGLPAMLAALAFWAFAGKLGLLGLLVAIVAGGVVYLIVGAVVAAGKRRG